MDMDWRCILSWRRAARAGLGAGRVWGGRAGAGRMDGCTQARKSPLPSRRRRATRCTAGAALRIAPAQAQANAIAAPTPPLHALRALCSSVRSGLSAASVVCIYARLINYLLILIHLLLTAISLVMRDARGLLSLSSQSQYSIVSRVLALLLRACYVL